MHFFITSTVNEIVHFFFLGGGLGGFLWNRYKMTMVEDTLNLMAHIIKEIKFPIYFIHSLFFIWLTVYDILGVFWGLWLKKKHFELPLQNQCQGICFRVKEYVLGSRNPMKWVSSLKQNIYLCSLATMKIRCKIRFF